MKSKINNFFVFLVFRGWTDWHFAKWVKAKNVPHARGDTTIKRLEF